MIHVTADIRAGGENTRTAQATFVTFLHLQFFTAITICKSRLWHLHFYPSVVRSLFCVSRRDILESCWCKCHRIAYCDGSTRRRKVAVCPYHSLRCAPQALRGFAVTEDIHLSQDMSPSTRTNSMNRRDFLMRSGQATPIPQGGNVSEHWSNSLPSTSFNTFQISFLTLEITNPTTVQVERASRKQPHSADALYGPGRYEKILRMESQELGISNRISEEVARSELETMERDARFALFCYDQKFKIAVWEHQRQAREAVNQAVQDSFDSLRCCDDDGTFKVFRIDMKDDSKK